MSTSKPRILLSALQGLSQGWRLLLLAAATSAAVLGGCGGGVGTGGTGSFSTSYASGSITGFGSVIVNGVRFEDSTALVEDSDGGRRTRDDLRLGMTVDIDSGPITTTATGATATASRIRVESELVGPVGSVDVAGSSLTVLGQRVTVNTATVFDDSLAGGLALLTPAMALQVYAVYDPTLASYRASRIEPAAATLALRLRGPLAAVDTVAQTLSLGGASYSYAGATGVPAGLAAGQFVRLTLSATGQPAGSFVVTRFGTALRELADADDYKLRGIVSAFSTNASFSVNGRPVQTTATTAITIPAGATLGLGARVEVEGAVRAGVLVASEVAVVTEQQELEHPFEMRGSIVSIDVAASTFVLRGQTVDFGRAGVRYRPSGKSAADLLPGVAVKVEGLLSADGRRLVAATISFD